MQAAELVPSETTGTLFAPPPAAVDKNVVAVASVTMDRAPAPAVAADGSDATVVVPVTGTISLAEPVPAFSAFKYATFDDHVKAARS